MEWVDIIYILKGECKMNIIDETKNLISYGIEDTYDDENDRASKIRSLSEAALNCAKADAEERKSKHEAIRGYVDSGVKLILGAASTMLAVVTLKLSTEGRPLVGSFKDIFKDLTNVLKK